MKRLIEQEACDEHDNFECDEWSDELMGWCPGSSSREVVVDYEAAGEVLKDDYYPLLDEPMTLHGLVAKYVVDAALGIGAKPLPTAEDVFGILGGGR